MKETLQSAEAIQKFKKLVEDVNVCMFTTQDDEARLFSRPMTTVQVDDEGNAWFFTNEYSEKINEVSKDNCVYLIYSHPGKNVFVTVRGTCSIILDKNKINELWNPLLKAWYPGGVDDPKLCLIKVETDEAYYWNSSSSKMLVYFKMLKAIANREQYKQAETGKLSLK